MDNSSTLCVFCCFSFYPPKKGREDNGEVEQNHHEIRNKPNNQSSKFKDFVETLDLEFDPGETCKLGDSVCQDCFKLVRTVINSKRKTDLVEEKVRQMSKEILKAIKELDNCLVRFQNDLRCVEDTVSNSDLACLQSYVRSGRYSGDVLILREKIIDVVNDTGAFRNDLQVKVYNELKKLNYSSSIHLKRKRRKSQLPEVFGDIITTTTTTSPILSPVGLTRKGALPPKPIAPKPQVKSTPPGNNEGQKIIRIIALPKAQDSNDNTTVPSRTTARMTGKKKKTKQQNNDQGQEEEYKCRACRRVFATWTLMKEHETSHKLYECQWPECHKSFTSSGNLKAHERLHTGERPYKCADCPKRFKQLGGLQYHLRANPSHRQLKYAMQEDATSDIINSGSRKRKRVSSTMVNPASQHYFDEYGGNAATPVVSRVHRNSVPSIDNEDDYYEDDDSWNNGLTIDSDAVEVNLHEQFEEYQQLDDNSCSSYPVIDYPVPGTTMMADQEDDEDPLADIQGYSIAHS